MKTRQAAPADLPRLNEMYRVLVRQMAGQGHAIWDEVYPCVCLPGDIQAGRLFVLEDGGAPKAAFALCRDDAAAALHLLCTLREPPAGIYNLTDRTPMQMGEIYSYLSNLLGKPAPQPEPLPAEARRGFSNQRISCSRLLALGWEPLYPSFADGVHNVLEALEE